MLHFFPAFPLINFSHFPIDFLFADFLQIFKNIFLYFYIAILLQLYKSINTENKKSIKVFYCFSIFIDMYENTSPAITWPGILLHLHE